MTDAKRAAPGEGNPLLETSSNGFSDSTSGIADQAARRWTTRLDPARTRQFGCEELHAAFFAPLDDRNGPAEGGAIVIQIPETPSTIIEAALTFARANRARVMFLCDTAAQANSAAAVAAKMLPHHRRVPMERAQAAAWGAIQ